LPPHLEGRDGEEAEAEAEAEAEERWYGDGDDESRYRHDELGQARLGWVDAQLNDNDMQCKENETCLEFS
jgi:hypothetical protein